MKLNKKLITSFSLGIAMASGLALCASAMPIWDAKLECSNPVYSAPYGQMIAYGGATNLYLSCTATKSGEPTKSSSNSWAKAPGKAYVETYGPTFKAAGTSFTGTAQGTDCTGVYHNESAGPISY